MLGKTQKTRAFSLVELLVVIAIIATLAAIISPAFFATLTAVRKTGTLQNMKQLTMASGVYATDNDENLPQVMPGPGGTPSAISWFAVRNFQLSLGSYVKEGGALKPTDLSPTKDGLWFDKTDPDRSRDILWSSFLFNGYMVAMTRNTSSIENTSMSVYMSLRASRWSTAVNVQTPAPLPGPNDPFWSSEYFNLFISPWSRDYYFTSGPYHWSSGRAAPPCSHYPNHAQCEDWNSRIEGEWNEYLHGMPRSKKGVTRFGEQTLFSYADGHTKAMPFAKTYKSSEDNHWGVVSANAYTAPADAGRP